MRAPRDLAFCAAVLCVIGARFRRRLSPTEDASDPLDPLVEPLETRDTSLVLDRRVPKLLTDGARNIEKAESSSLDVLRELPAREPGLELARELLRLDADPLRAE